MLLNSNAVDYIVIGAYAVGFHGRPRFTGDLDVLVRPEPENAHRILKTLRELGFEPLGFKPEDLHTLDRVIQLGIAPIRIDILTSITGVTVEEAWAGRCSGELDGIPTYFLGRTELIRNKEAIGRARDLGDAEELRKRE